jgi:hypothetical protein
METVDDWTRRLALAAACAAALCLSACGSGGERRTTPPPTLPRALAHSLAARTDEVASALAAGDSCRAATLARELQQQTIASINRGAVAPALQEPLSGVVNDLVARVVCVPPPAPPQEHGHGKHKGHDKQNEGGD